MEKAPDAFRTISEVADELDVPQHVLRFWETRFSQIRPMKRGGGRRYYRPDDLDLLRGIRHLLYGEGYTIRGVQRILRDQGVKFVQAAWQAGAPLPPRDPTDDVEADEDEAAAEPQAARGSRGLFGLLSGRRESETDLEPEGPAQDEPHREPTPEAGDPHIEDKIEPTFASAPPRVEPAAPRVAQPSPAPAPPAAAPAIALSREDLRKLQASLHELSECRRLIDQVMVDEQNP